MNDNGSGRDWNSAGSQDSQRFEERILGPGAVRDFHRTLKFFGLLVAQVCWNMTVSTSREWEVRLLSGDDDGWACKDGNKVRISMEE